MTAVFENNCLRTHLADAVTSTFFSTNSFELKKKYQLICSTTNLIICARTAQTKTGRNLQLLQFLWDCPSVLFAHCSFHSLFAIVPVWKWTAFMECSSCLLNNHSPLQHMPHSPIHTRSHTDGIGFHAGCQRAHQERYFNTSNIEMLTYSHTDPLGVQCHAQGHLHVGIMQNLCWNRHKWPALL